MHIHVSDMRAFSDCRLRWSFSSHMRKGRAPIVAGRALQLGTLCHRALELWYTDKSQDPQDCVAQGVAELTASDIPYETTLSDEAYGILVNYANWARIYDDFEPITQEQEFIVPLVGDHQFSGRWDMVVEREGKIWINDFKITGSQFNSYAEYLTQQDEQARAYSWAGKQVYGSDFGGIMFTLVRNKAPDIPVRLKNGSISRNKGIKTTWERYRQAILEGGEHPSDYSEMEQILNGNPFVFRVHMSLGKRALEAFHQRAVATTLEMTNPDVLIYPNASVMSCRMCAFRFPCAVWHSISPAAADHILFTEYTESRYAQAANDEDKVHAIVPEGD
jgi:hypothetical protein